MVVQWICRYVTSVHTSRRTKEGYDGIPQAENSGEAVCSQPESFEVHLHELDKAELVERLPLSSGSTTGTDSHSRSTRALVQEVAYAVWSNPMQHSLYVAIRSPGVIDVVNTDTMQVDERVVTAAGVPDRVRSRPTNPVRLPPTELCRGGLRGVASLTSHEQL